MSTTSPNTPPPAALEFDPALNLARQSVYRFISLALADPRTGVWRRLVQEDIQKLVREAAAILRDEPAAVASELGMGERLLLELDPSIALERLPASAEQLNELFEKTFGLLASCACPPCETEYIDAKLTFQRSHALADVSGFYSAFGLKLAAQHPERQDHITLELEFMAFLIGMEREAALAAAPEKEQWEICHDAQKRFLGEHLIGWTPAFCHLLARECPDGFYAAVAEFLAAWIPAERALLGVAAPCGNAEPSAIERPDECAGCDLAH